MRILHWTESFHPRIGGAEIFTRQLAAALMLRGHKCAVITNQVGALPGHEEINGMEVYRFPMAAALANRDLRAIARLSAETQTRVRAWHPDILHLHSAQPGAFFCLHTQKTLRIPLVFTTHDPPLGDPAQNPLWLQILAAATSVACISNAMRNRIIEAAPMTTPKARLILNALNAPTGVPTTPGFHPPTLLCAARLCPEKGVDVLLHSLPAIRAVLPDLQTVIAGDGPARAGLQALAAKLDLSQTVTFPGWIDPEDMSEAIIRATLVAAPSRWEEPFGLTVLQAMQRARPVVASRVGGLSEVVLHEETGLLVPPDDAPALGAAIVRILRDPALAIRFGQQGRERAENVFGWDRCLSEYETLYRQVSA